MIYSGSEFFIFGLRIRIRIRLGDCFTTSKDDKIVLEKIKYLIKILVINVVKKAFFVFLKISFYIGRIRIRNPAL